MTTERTNKIYYCPIEVAIDLVGGKWKPLILSHLREGCLGFEEIGRRVPLATRGMLAGQLRELERDGLVQRRELAEFPPPIEYSLTVEGCRLIPILDQLRQFGRDFASRSGVEIHEELELYEATASPALSEAS
ncbi:MAG: helix-turn-helix domain-containing protein [Acidobacteriota bacterium]